MPGFEQQPGCEQPDGAAAAGGAVCEWGAGLSGLHCQRALRQQSAAVQPGLETGYGSPELVAQYLELSCQGGPDCL